jgi:hypothetical protein
MDRGCGGSIRSSDQLIQEAVVFLLSLSTRGEVEGYDAFEAETEAEAVRHARSAHRQSRIGVELWKEGRLLARLPERSDDWRQEGAAGKKASLTRDHARIDDRLERPVATALFGRPRSRKSGGPNCPSPKSQH